MKSGGSQRAAIAETIAAIKKFTGRPPRGWESPGLTETDETLDLLAEAGIDPRFVMAHAAYVLNTATAEEEKYSRARAGLAKELERSTMLGIGSICFHPGAAIDGDRDAAAARVAGAITHALETVPHGTTRVLVENTGSGARFAGPIARKLVHYYFTRQKEVGDDLSEASQEASVANGLRSVSGGDSNAHRPAAVQRGGAR